MEDKEYNIEEEILKDNISDSEDLDNIDASDIIVYARDWTIDTMYDQIHQGNIILNPKFQRRNAWNDEKRSKLIESIIMGYPVPEIVLAESPKGRRKFIVIDGRQRLLTISGFINNEVFKYWTHPKLQKLKVKKELNGRKYSEFDIDEKREFGNSSLRCTVITNYKNDDVLYDIFYRLNSGSVALSTQELRNSLNPGEFADFLVEQTNTLQPIHKVMNLKGPDNRFRDIEIILRTMVFSLFAKEYKGNLKNFLDEKMRYITINWKDYSNKIAQLYTNINSAIGLLQDTLGNYLYIGRKYEDGKFGTRFNKVIFEVEAVYFQQIKNATGDQKKKFLEGLIKLFAEPTFRDSIERSTKNMENYKIRYSKFQKLVNESFNLDLDINPFK